MSLWQYSFATVSGSTSHVVGWVSISNGVTSHVVGGVSISNGVALASHFVGGASLSD
jgi:hypothetical protein